MRARDLIPLSLRRSIAGMALRPASEVKLALEEARGLRYGRGIAAGADGAVVAATPRRAGRLETYFDTHTVGPGIWKWRHYFDIYERHFAKFTGREVHVLEIGVFSGGSLGMWQDYFGPACRVYGVDLVPECKAYETETIKIFIGDQSDPEFWRQFLREVPRIDVVVDDGGHLVHQQVATFESLFAHLQPGGVYLCEDVHGSANPFNGYVSGLARSLNSWEGPTGFQKLVGSIHLYPFVAVLEKPDVPMTEMDSPRRGTEWQPFL